VGVGFLLRQGDSYFYTGYTIVDQGSGWVTISSVSSLTGATWTKLVGSQAAPNFSANGAPMQFGYITINSKPAGSIYTTTFGVANLSITENSNTYTDMLFSNSNWVEALLAYDSLGDPSDTKSSSITVH
jgi:hypothetical protein